jgi:hypothetical protein
MQKIPNNAASNGFIGDKIITGTDQKVKTVVYIEVNNYNPLNAASYILEDGTLLFDYAVIFAANIRNRNCGADPKSNDGCTENGPHVHLNENVRRLLENREKYIKPLQDKGIKVLLGLLGDHDGISFGTMNDTERAAFTANIKRDVETYGLDGINFDDEWGSKEDTDNWGENQETISPNSIWTYPVTELHWPFRATVYRNPNMGIAAGNGQFDAPSEDDQNRMWQESGENYYKTIKAAREALGPDKIVSLYEYNAGRYITPEGRPNGEAAVDLLRDALDFTLQPWYSQYIADSANGLARSIYSPFGMDLGGEAYYQNGTPLPPIVSSDGDEHGPNTIYDYSTRFKNAAAEGKAYNMLYLYSLRPASELLKHDPDEAAPSVTREAYISMMTGILFGQECVLADHGDYRKDW